MNVDVSYRGGGQFYKPVNSFFHKTGKYASGCLGAIVTQERGLRNSRAITAVCCTFYLSRVQC